MTLIYLFKGSGVAIFKKEEKKIGIIETSLKLFSKKGFYNTTIPDIAKTLNMSVGNMYNYFSSKEELAMAIMRYTSDILGEKIRKINNMKITTKEKIRKIVAMYFEIANKRPEMIEYFLRVYLSNRDIFKNGCEGMICVSAFVTEIMIFFEEGVRCGELRDQDFFSAFGLFMGYLGGMVFLNGEGVLEKSLNDYIDDISENIYFALKA
ncbi:MAG: TetR/AcrR family transcriptional regulator [Epsilonproteobacteria bacterium]|nr:TetR/AcrR family transcriptional regulator [Campylobacterota bacterium]